MVKSLEALPRSPSPLLKKKLAPSCLLSVKCWAIVLLIVDLPVPAIPFNQNMHLLSGFEAHSLISLSILALVSRWHLGSDWLEKESKAASSTAGNRDRARLVSI